MNWQDDPPSGMDAIAEEFVAKLRRGEEPDVSEIVRSHPDLEEEIRDTLPVLRMMEAARGEEESWAPGTRMLGDYELIREIGRGGMGVVYEAVQRTLGRRVALKLLPAQATADPRHLERFKQEATAAARLQHPNIVPVIGLEQHEGIRYFAMQLIDGHGLDALVTALGPEHKDGDDSNASSILSALHLQDVGTSSFSVISHAQRHELKKAPARRSSLRSKRGRYYRNIARLGLQAAEGLAYAHAQGVLHRDVKPANLLLDKKGNLWIADFGLCKDVDSDDLTQSGDLLGTLRYVPPERLNGSSDVRGDNYGLGATLYELLTRQTLFHGVSRSNLLQCIAHETPKRPRKFDEHIPTDLEVIVQKAMAREPERRYATADALANDLRAFLSGHRIEARPPSLAYTLRMGFRRHRAWVIPAALASVVLIASSFYYVGGLKAREATARQKQYAATIAAAQTALDSDDVLLAEQWLDDAPPELRNFEWHYLHSQLDSHVKEYPSVGRYIHEIAYSPDGAWMAIGTEHQVRIHRVGSSDPPRDIASKGRVIAWHPTKELVAGGGRGNTIKLFDAKSGETIQTMDVVTEAFDLCMTHDRLIVGCTDHRVRVYALASGELLNTWENNSRVYCVAATPDGSNIVSGTWSGHVYSWAPGQEEPRWSVRLHTQKMIDVAVVGTTLIAATAQNNSATLLDASTGNTVRSFGGRDSRALGVDNTQSRLAISEGRAVSIWDVSSGEELRRVRQGHTVSAVAFSHQGDRLLVGSEAGTLKEWDVTGRNEPDALLGHLDDVNGIVPHPDGRTIVTGGAGPMIYVWDLDAQRLKRTWFGNASWQDAYAFDKSGKYLLGRVLGDLVIWDFEDGTIVEQFEGSRHWLTHGAFFDGDRKLVSTADDGTISIWERASATRKSFLRVPDGGQAVFDMLQDGPVMAVGGGKGFLRLWNANTEKWGLQLTGHEGQVNAVAFSPDGSMLASVGHDRSLRLWDLATGSHRSLIQPDLNLGMSTIQHDVTFSPDGTRIATGGRDGHIRLWSVAEGKLVCTLRGHLGWLYCVRFAEDGSRLYSSTGSSQLRIWETRGIGERSEHFRDAWLEAQSALPEFERALEQTGDIDQAIAALEQNESLSPSVREAALQLAHEKRITPDELVARLWRMLRPPNPKPEDLSSMYALASARWRAVGHQGMQDSRATTQLGLAAFRAKNFGLAKRHLRSAASLHKRSDPDLYAVALAFLARAYLEAPKITDKQRSEASELQAALARLLASNQDIRTPRSEQFLDEALEAFKQHAKRESTESSTEEGEPK